MQADLAQPVYIVRDSVKLFHRTQAWSSLHRGPAIYGTSYNTIYCCELLQKVRWLGWLAYYEGG